MTTSDDRWLAACQLTRDEIDGAIMASVTAALAIVEDRSDDELSELISASRAAPADLLVIWAQLAAIAATLVCELARHEELEPGEVMQRVAVAFARQQDTSRLRAAVMADGHSFHVVDAHHGVPTRCECSCGWVWTRPPGDDHADTLPAAARAHEREARGADR